MKIYILFTNKHFSGVFNSLYELYKEINEYIYELNEMGDLILDDDF